MDPSLSLWGTLEDVVVVEHLFVLVCQEADACLVGILALQFIDLDGILKLQYLGRFVLCLELLCILKKLREELLVHSVDALFQIRVLKHHVDGCSRVCNKHLNMMRDSHTILLSY